MPTPTLLFVHPLRKISLLGSAKCPGTQQQAGSTPPGTQGYSECKATQVHRQAAEQGSRNGGCPGGREASREDEEKGSRRSDRGAESSSREPVAGMELIHALTCMGFMTALGGPIPVWLSGGGVA